ncbi:MAG: LCP family protein [Clostridia bacterium]|nr:LCP family protein [Clostridia bacterium]
MRIGKGAKIILIIIAVLLLCCAALAVYVLLLPDPAPAEAAAGTAAPTQAPDGTPAPLYEDNDLQAIEGTPLPEELTSRTGEEALPDGVYNILFVGTDSRYAEDTEAEGLSDSMMVVSYDTTKDTITLVSFMRDSCVMRIGENTGWMGKLNAAYKNGGPDELVATLNLNFELGIKDYVAVGYDGFEMLIDELGGIDVPITSEEAYLINWRCAGIGQDGNKDGRLSQLQSLGLPAAEEGYEGTKVQHLTGLQALWYARNRTSPSADGEAGSDTVRVNRQQTLMMLIYEKVKTEKTLDTAMALIRFAIGYVKTDMDLVTMTRIGTAIYTAEDIQFVNVRVPFEGSYRLGDWTQGEIAWALYFDIDETGAQLREILYGTDEKR